MRESSVREKRRRVIVVRRLFCGLLALELLIAANLDALEDVLAILVELELGDDDVAGVDAEGHALARGLLARHALDVDDVFETVHRGDLALLVLVGATNDRDLVALADGDAADLLAMARVSKWEFGSD